MVDNGVDSHCRVFDTERFPYSPEAGYQPPEHEAGTAEQFAAGWCGSRNRSMVT